MENLKFVFKSFLTFGLSYFLISCATTSMDTGGQSPKDKAAIIKNLGDGNVIEVDGKSLSEGKAFLPRTLELSSGEHFLTLRYMHSSHLPVGYEVALVKNYKFNFVAGKTYVVKFSLSENEAKPQVSQSTNTELLRSSSSTVYVNNWNTRIVWLWIEESGN